MTGIVSQPGYKYRFIEDLPANWEQLRSSELEGLAKAWIDRRSDLEDSNALREFMRKLVNAWSIETGILEQLYDIDRGITLTLIERGLEASLIPHGTTNKPPELVAQILNDHKFALDGMFSFVNQKRKLSESYILELHQALTAHQTHTDAVDQFGTVIKVPLLRGQYKQQSNNPLRPDGRTHEYCPPEHVGAQMAQLVAWHHEHEAKDVPTSIEAAWFHHRFTQIHPFQDGNGRVARALSSLIYIKHEWFPIVVHRDDRDTYIRALEEADHGNLAPLVQLFAQIEKRTFTKAQALAEDVLSERLSVPDGTQLLLQSIEDHFKKKAAKHTIERQRRIDTTLNDLVGIAFTKASDLAASLAPILLEQSHSYGAWAERSDGSTGTWYQKQIIDVAHALDYFADFRAYRAWVRLKIREQRSAYLVVSFHCLGAKFVGIGAASAFLEYRDVDESGDTIIEGPYPICSEVFQFSYTEDAGAVVKRFREWSETAFVTGLAQWKRQLGGD